MNPLSLHGLFYMSFRPAKSEAITFKEEMKATEKKGEKNGEKLTKKKEKMKESRKLTRQLWFPSLQLVLIHTPRSRLKEISELHRPPASTRGFPFWFFLFVSYQSRPILITSSPGVRRGGCVPGHADCSPDSKGECFRAALWHAPFATESRTSRSTQPTSFLSCSRPLSGAVSASSGALQKQAGLFAGQTRGNSVWGDSHARPRRAPETVSEAKSEGNPGAGAQLDGKLKETPLETRDVVLGGEDHDEQEERALEGAERREGATRKAMKVDTRHASTAWGFASPRRATHVSSPGVYRKEHKVSLSPAKGEPAGFGVGEREMLRETPTAWWSCSGVYKGEHAMHADLNSHDSARFRRAGTRAVLAPFRASGNDGEREKEALRREREANERRQVGCQSARSGPRLSSDSERAWGSSTPLPESAHKDCADSGERQVSQLSEETRGPPEILSRGEALDGGEATVLDVEGGPGYEDESQMPSPLRRSPATADAASGARDATQVLLTTPGRTPAEGEKRARRRAEKKAARSGGKVGETPTEDEVCGEPRQGEESGWQVGKERRRGAVGRWESAVDVEEKCRVEERRRFEDACLEPFPSSHSEEKQSEEHAKDTEAEGTPSMTAALPRRSSPRHFLERDEAWHGTSVQGTPESVSPSDMRRLAPPAASPHSSPSSNSRVSSSLDACERHSKQLLRGCSGEGECREGEHEEDEPEGEETEQEARKQEEVEPEAGEEEGSNEKGNTAEDGVVPQRASIIERSVRRASKLIGSGKPHKNGRRVKINLKSTKSFWPRHAARRFKYPRGYRLPSLPRHFRFLSTEKRTAEKDRGSLLALLSHPRSLLASSHFSLKSPSASLPALSTALRAKPTAAEMRVMHPKRAAAEPQEQPKPKSPDHAGHVSLRCRTTDGPRGRQDCREEAEEGRMSVPKNVDDMTVSCLSPEAVTCLDGRARRCRCSVYHFPHEDKVGVYDTFLASPCWSSCSYTSPWTSHLSSPCWKPRREERAVCVSFQRMESLPHFASASLSEAHGRPRDRSSFFRVEEQETRARETFLDLNTPSEPHDLQALDRSSSRRRHPCIRLAPAARRGCCETDTQFMQGKSEFEHHFGCTDTVRPTSSAHSKIGSKLQSAFKDDRGNRPTEKTPDLGAPQNASEKSKKTIKRLERPASIARHGQHDGEEAQDAPLRTPKSLPSQNSADQPIRPLHVRYPQSRIGSEEGRGQEKDEKVRKRAVRTPWEGREKCGGRREGTDEARGICGNGKTANAKVMRDASVENSDFLETEAKLRDPPKRGGCRWEREASSEDEYGEPLERRHKTAQPLPPIPLFRPVCCHPIVYREGKRAPRHHSCLRPAVSSSTDLLFKQYVKEVESVERQIEREERLRKRRKGSGEGDVEHLQQIVTKSTKLVYFLIIVNITVLMLCFFFALFPMHLSNHEKTRDDLPEPSFYEMSESTEPVRALAAFPPSPLSPESSAPHVSSSPSFRSTSASPRPHPFLSSVALESKWRRRHIVHPAAAPHRGQEAVFGGREPVNLHEEEAKGSPRLFEEQRLDPPAAPSSPPLRSHHAPAQGETYTAKNETRGELWAGRQSTEGRERVEQAFSPAGNEKHLMLVTPLTELSEVPAEAFKDLVIVLKMNPSVEPSGAAGSTVTKVLSVAGVEEQAAKGNPGGSTRKTIFFYTGETLQVDNKSATLKNAKGEVVYCWDFVDRSSAVSAFCVRHKEKEGGKSETLEGLLPRSLSSLSLSGTQPTVMPLGASHPAPDSRSSKQGEADRKSQGENKSTQSSRDPSEQEQAAPSTSSVLTDQTKSGAAFAASENQQQKQKATGSRHGNLKVVEATRDPAEPPAIPVLNEEKRDFIPAKDRKGERSLSLRRTRVVEAGGGAAKERGRRTFAGREKMEGGGRKAEEREDEKGETENATGGARAPVTRGTKDTPEEEKRGKRKDEEPLSASQPGMTREDPEAKDSVCHQSAETDKQPPKAPPRRLMANAMLGFANAFDQFARLGGALLSPAISMAQTLDVAGALIANPQAAGLGANALPAYSPPSSLAFVSAGAPSYGPFAAAAPGPIVSGIAANTPPPPRLPLAVGGSGLSASYGPAAVSQSQPAIVYSASAAPQQTYLIGGLGPGYSVSTASVGADSAFLTYPGNYYTDGGVLTSLPVGGYQAMTVATPTGNDGALYFIATGQENRNSEGGEYRNVGSAYSDGGAWESPASPNMTPEGSGMLGSSLGEPLGRMLQSWRGSLEEPTKAGSGDPRPERKASARTDQDFETRVRTGERDLRADSANRSHVGSNARRSLENASSLRHEGEQRSLDDGESKGPEAHSNNQRGETEQHGKSEKREDDDDTTRGSHAQGVWPCVGEKIAPPKDTNEARVLGRASERKTHIERGEENTTEAATDQHPCKREANVHEAEGQRDAAPIGTLCRSE
ncbi:conserved hypothetical protein [Neospora caninum Liverpool]|uniref:Uncharacterized protein n=1 Tax=Neospora caninum (strain Liverpool) TaxID=572307 RepID=F0VIF3_NEOCL|nr:conserved hypothetical protein [Neospora caninum Liverpool]CBZ53514.1 conserved hypothetical protein [Neospora caninum Liverpool]CEL67502.1 TPA: hypothetical protein BN1204_033020 [Neospora caninum Liverpool]|eukprot:XP_003883546.1 conserved hypothetical protein [Neospora caninum Liverpool]